MIYPRSLGLKLASQGASTVHPDEGISMALLALNLCQGPTVAPDQERWPGAGRGHLKTEAQGQDSD